MQKLIEETYLSERSKYSQEVQRKIKQQMLLLKNRQDLEINSLRQKIAQARDEKKREHKQQLHKLTQKYTNVKM